MARLRSTPKIVGVSSLDELQAVLDGLCEVDRLQIRAGVRPISPALHDRRLRYQRHDPDEAWRTIREVWRHGGGDCEDLACAVAAELREQGVAARPFAYMPRSNLVHVVVKLPDGRTVDPSRTGGMRVP